MQTEALELLLVEDDPLDRQLLQIGFDRDRRTRVHCAASADEALRWLDRKNCDAVVTDLRMPGMNGLDLIRHIRTANPDLPIVAITADSAPDRAAEGRRAGAVECLVKPIDINRLIGLLDRLTRIRLSDDVDAVFLGDHPRLEEARTFVRRVARIPFARVLLTGESGTGKSMLARCIHDGSGATGNFMVINCAALPANLLESELFGYEKGAFTDARSSRPGLVELAAEGTLFLDEIGAMPLEIQAKLLLFLEDGEIRRLGGRKTIPVRTRVIAASNENLRSRVANRTFRTDLFYRLDVASLDLPTLRETPDIIAGLAERMLIEACRRYHKPLPVLDRDTFEPLLAHSWPGNARELRNVIERSVMFLEDGTLRWHLPPAEPSEKMFWMRPGMTIEEVEREYMLATFRAFPHADYVTLAARLGISRKTLWKKRLKYGLPTRDEC